jgi:hypothetical protein
VGFAPGDGDDSFAFLVQFVQARQTHRDSFRYAECDSGATALSLVCHSFLPEVRL